MNVKKTLPLVIAVIFGLISARMVAQMVRGGRTAVVAGPHMTAVVIASRDIAAGEELSPDSLSVSEVPTDAAPAKCFSGIADLNGRVAAAPLSAKQVILESFLAPKGSGSGLQAVIPPGMRALTIDVNEVSGVAGYVTPGCRVDMIQTLRDGSGNDPISRCIAQNVPVTAVGERNQGGQAEEARSVTLLVTPREAELIELACANGHPRLVLRSSRDQETAEPGAVTLSDLTGEAAAPVAPQRVVAAAATQPANLWQMKVISGGQESLVNVGMSPEPEHSAVTGTSEEESH